MATFTLESVSGIGSLNAMRLSNVAAGVVVNKLGASTYSMKSSYKRVRLRGWSLGRGEEARARIRKLG